MASLIGVFQTHGVDDGRITVEPMTPREAKAAGYIRNTRPQPSKYSSPLQGGFVMQGGLRAGK